MDNENNKENNIENTESKNIIQINRLGLPVIMSGGKTMLEAHLEDKFDRFD